MTTAHSPEYSRDGYTVANSVGRGLRRTCPHCGAKGIFKGYLKVRENCETCDAPVGEIRADDLPPYLTIFLVGHIVVPTLLLVEAMYHPPIWLQMAVWPTITVALTLLFLPFIKGAAVGLMRYLKIKGDEQR